MAASAFNGFEDKLDAHGRPTGGFGFENVLRNGMLQKQSGLRLPKAHKTGTTIVGMVYSGGVVLGADTRATEGSTICDKNCEKIHYIAPNIWCCGAGPPPPGNARAGRRGAGAGIARAFRSPAPSRSPTRARLRAPLACALRLPARSPARSPAMRSRCSTPRPSPPTRCVLRHVG